MSGDVEVAYSAGRRNGTSAPYQRATSAISSESVEHDDALEHAALERGLDRVREQRMPSERPDVLPRDALGARAGGDERDRGRRVIERPADAASSVSVGHRARRAAPPHGAPSRRSRRARSVARRRRPAPRRSSSRRPSRSMMSHWPRRAAGRRRPPPRRTPRRPPAGDAGATRRPRAARRPCGRVAAVAAASAAIRAALCQRTRFSLSPTRTSMRPRRRRSATRSSSPRGSSSDAIVMTGERVASMICTRPARYAWKCEMLPAATRPAKRARSSSMCSSPFRSGRTTALGDGSGIDALERLLERRRLHRHEQQPDGLLELLGDLGRTVTASVRRLDDDARERDDPDRLRARDADGGTPARRAHGERAADGPGPRTATVRSCSPRALSEWGPRYPCSSMDASVRADERRSRAPDRRSGSRPSSRNRRRAPRPLPRASRCPSSLTPPKPMCGSEPCVPPFTTTTPACTVSAKRIARWTLAVWIAAVSPYGESFTSAIASSRSRAR